MIVAEMGRFGRAAVVKGPLTKGDKVGGVPPPAIPLAEGAQNSQIISCIKFVNFVVRRPVGWGVVNFVNFMNVVRLGRRDTACPFV